MREILFRGKRLDNGEWADGDLVHSVYKVGDACVGKFGCTLGMHQVDPSTVGQYTGLNDKNGKRIFEGDIVKAQDEILGSPFCDGMNGKVVYDEAAYFIELKDPMNSQWLYDECAVYEVIGNVHDNPELLEK